MERHNLPKKAQCSQECHESNNEANDSYELVILMSQLKRYTKHTQFC